MAFVTSGPGRISTELAHKPRPTSGMQTVIPLAAFSIALIGAVPAMVDAVLSMPVHDEAGTRFALHYSRFARTPHANRIDLRISAASGKQVTVTLGNHTGSPGRLVRIDPSPVSTTYRPGNVSMIFQAPPEGDLALAFHVQDLALGWTTRSLHIGVGRTISASMTIHQLVIP
jgi:hypothetical protein